MVIWPWPRFVRAPCATEAAAKAADPLAKGSSMKRPEMMTSESVVSTRLSAPRLITPEKVSRPFLAASPMAKVSLRSL